MGLRGPVSGAATFKFNDEMKSRRINQNELKMA